jgi:micrococcal nuclease
MKNIMVLLSCFLLFLSVAQGREYGTIKNAQYVKCYDGDTCRFNIPGLHPIIGENVSIRLNGIDTPEIRGKCQNEKQLAKTGKG